MVRSTPDSIRTSNGWVQQFPLTTTILVQAGNRDEASRDQTTTRKVDNKIENFPNSAPKSWNWSQPSNDWFPSSQAKAIMSNQQKGEMDCKQETYLVDNLRRPTNDGCGAYYCVGWRVTLAPSYPTMPVLYTRKKITATKLDSLLEYILPIGVFHQ